MLEVETVLTAVSQLELTEQRSNPRPAADRAVKIWCKREMFAAFDENPS